MSAPKLKFQCYRQKARHCKPHVRERDNRWWEKPAMNRQAASDTCANQKGTDCKALDFVDFAYHAAHL